MALLEAIAGPIIGGALGIVGQQKENAANAEQARIQMDFQERMSGSAHQREVADLRKAGLNPILSGTGGMGASTPSGSMAQMRSALASGVSSAMAVRRQNAELDNIRKDTELKDQQFWTTRSQMHLNNRLENIGSVNEAIAHENRREAAANADIAEFTAKGSKIEGEIDSSTWGKVMRYLNRANPFSHGSSAVLNSIKK